MFFTECDLNAFCLCCALLFGLIYNSGLVERAHLKRTNMFRHINMMFYEDTYHFMLNVYLYLKRVTLIFSWIECHFNLTMYVNDFYLKY